MLGGMTTLGGEGEITAAGDTAKLHKNIAVLMPVGLEFVMHSIGDDPLTMYVINEPTPERPESDHMHGTLRMGPDATTSVCRPVRPGTISPR